MIFEQVGLCVHVVFGGLAIMVTVFRDLSPVPS